MNTIPAEIHAHVLRRLAAVEAEHGVRILFAAESGSRAWGFASPDSDYDLRFIYAHRLDWYLALEPERDVIEGALDAHLVDLAGWDVRKALNLALKSNPALHEWLVSPHVYRDDGQFRAAAQALFEGHAETAALEHHYWSTARTQWRSEIQNRETPKLKRYFYVVRPLMALLWVKSHGLTSDRLPPMALADLMAGVEVPTDVRRAVDALLVAKRTTPELGTGARIDALDAWIEQSLTLLPAARPSNASHASAARAAATQLFHRTIQFADVQR
jgi:uncharacterized protein